MGGIHSSVGTAGAGLDWTAGQFVPGQAEHVDTNDYQKYVLKANDEEQVTKMA